MKKICLVALVSLAAFSATCMPVSAGKKNRNQQVINQTINIYGDGNSVNQSAEQNNAQNRSKPDRSQRNQARRVSAEQANHQEVNQSVDINGNDNYVEQSTRQTNVQNNSEDDKKRNRRGKKRNNRGHGRDDDDRRHDRDDDDDDDDDD